MLSSAIAKAHNLPYLEYSKKVSKLSNSLAISQTKLNANLYRSTLCPTSFKPKPVLLRPGRWLAPTAKLFRRVAPPLLAVGFVLDAKPMGWGTQRLA